MHWTLGSVSLDVCFTRVRLRLLLSSIFLGGMLSMSSVDHLGSLNGWLELLDGGRSLWTFKLETLQKVSNDLFSQFPSYGEKTSSFPKSEGSRVEVLCLVHNTLVRMKDH